MEQTGINEKTTDKLAPIEGVEESLWAFAVSIYARENIAALCLRAQDEHGVDVNLLLFSLWAAVNGRSVSADGLSRADALCVDWRNLVVQPLRQQRRQWKASAQHGKEYAAIKSLELDAERAQLGFLAGIIDDVSTRVQPAETEPARTMGIAGSNSAALLAHYGVAQHLNKELIEALLDACLT
ncbi:MAG: TIGR02444 family protein [Congregibacter sp.]